MFSDHISIFPPPSRQAVISIIEVIDFLEKGDRKTAARLLEGSYRAAHPRLFAAAELRFLNDQIAKKKGIVNHRPSPMKYDWVHYADAAIKLELADLLGAEQLLEAIEVFRTSPPPMETSSELDDRYNRYLSSREKKSRQSQNFIHKIFKWLRSRTNR
jgi:hypothetical protein